MTCQLIIAGVGGQGVLFAAKIMAHAAGRAGLPVLASQTFGMAQRGGSVMTHLKIGDFAGPLVRQGDADLLLGLDGTEAHRTLPYLRPRRDGRGAVCVVNAGAAQAFPDQRIGALLRDRGVTIHTCDADGAALAMKRPMAANLVLLGFAASGGDLPFSFDEIRDAALALGGAAHRQANLDALESGRRLQGGG